MIVAIAAVVACGEDTALSSPTPTTTPASTASSAPTPTTAATATTAPSVTAAAAKVSANNATVAQLTSAFTAAGIPNPSAWAREVEEYRPYAASDTNITKLRQNLAKYNPAPGVVDKIVATLSLP